MSNSKAALKAAKAAIDGQAWPEAVTQAEKVLAVDPQHYHANVFLGLALDKQNRHDDAEKAYGAAIKAKDRDALAWQGLVAVYEKQGQSRVDDYRRAAIRLVHVFEEQDDETRAQTVMDKFMAFAKTHGTRHQYRQALETILPSSSIYDFLEGRLQHPSMTLARIASIREAEEKERINKEIGERRTRLGARLGQVTTEVKREILAQSSLEDVYQNIIDWSNEDKVRREYEEKLLRHAYDTLLVLTESEKSDKRARVEELAKGMAILKHPYLLAWEVVLEWRDGTTLADWDAGLLREFIELFPEDGLAKVLRGFLAGEISPIPAAVTTDGSSDAVPDQDGTEYREDREEVQEVSTEDRLLSMMDGIDEKPDSILARRLMGDYYVFLEEYESAMEISRAAQKLVAMERHKTGLIFENTLDSVNITLATALVYHETPRNHAEAKVLFDEVLARKPTMTPALIGIGLILEEQEEYARAADFLDRAVARDPNIRIKSEAAWCKAVSEGYSQGLQALEACIPDIKGTDIGSRALKAATLHRIGLCLWHVNPSKASRKDRKGAYSYFLSALQANMNFAPAYTSLGIYYFDYAKDKKRARKCFQKAFELSASEVEAAERLARGFADQGDWELVEVVSQRVVDSGKVRPTPGSKRRGVSWPFAALGVAQLNKQDYAKSVASFQAALRISPGDYHSWVGLGESYHNSGRYIAATKAFQQAAKLEVDSAGKLRDESWFAKYMLANVKRELGDYDEAVQEYEQVSKHRLGEFGVQIALLQTLVESAWHSIETGFFGKASHLATQVVGLGLDIAKHRSDAFNLWKAVGDACSILSFASKTITGTLLMRVQSLLSTDVRQEVYDLLVDVDGVGKSDLSMPHDSKASSSMPTVKILYAAILAHKRAVDACANEPHAQAVAWFNLGCTEYRASQSLSQESQRLLGHGQPTAIESDKRSLQHRKAAVRCFKRAIELEAGSAEFWNALGVATSQLNVKISQHSFIRSLYLNDKSARVWTNLGALYFLQDDIQLANEAFTRAQSADPDYPMAWLGQGLLADHLGDPQEAQSLFTHAFEIADSSLVLVQRHFVFSSFDQLLKSTSPSSVQDVLQCLFALQQVQSQTRNGLPSSHLGALFLERVGDYLSSADSLTAICSEVEQDYELTESPTSLVRFAQAKADLARARLAAHDFDAASQSAETSLQLASDDGDESNDAFSPAARRKCRLSAHLTAGLAYYYHGSMDEAINMFRAALEESDGAPDVVCLLAQVLWAKGGNDERSVAREQLLASVQRHSGHLQSTLLLGTIAVLDEDEDAVDAVADDLRDFRAKEALTEDQHRKVDELLAAAATFQGISAQSTEGETAETMTSILLGPWSPHGWSQLANVVDDPYPAEMALLTARRSVPPNGTLEAEDLANAFAGTSKMADMQRAIMVAPWRSKGWKALSDAVGR